MMAGIDDRPRALPRAGEPLVLAFPVNVLPQNPLPPAKEPLGHLLGRIGHPEGTQDPNLFRVALLKAPLIGRAGVSFLHGPH
jgi:hypothetical protein